MNSNTLCTICARGGSKGVKNKNIRLLLGKPLIAYSIIKAIESKLFEHIVVSTDSDAIAEVAEQYGAEVFFKRSDNLAGDTASKFPVVQDALIRSEEHYGKKFDFLVDLDATSPLRNAEDIISAFNQFIKKDNDNLITAMPARRSPYFNLIEMNNKGQVVLSKEVNPPIIRRQDSPKCFDMNASIYIFKRDVLLKANTVFLKKTGLYVMPEERSIDIDSEQDFKFVEFLMRERETIK
jgi:CMP-N,N'-diacetyllegionaminic acid synthase